VEANFIRLIRAYLKDHGLRLVDAKIDRLFGDGSNRMFWRISMKAREFRFIAMSNPPCDRLTERENSAYLFLGRHLRKKGIPVPEIYRFDLESGWFIMQDLGEVSLQDAVVRGDDAIPLYRKAIDILLQLQISGAQGFQTRWCCQTERYDRTVMRKLESDYFRDAFLQRYLGLEGKRLELDSAFAHLADRASRMEASFFLHRDFQSRNIMIANEQIGIVDWQGGRLGPLAYDLASLINDPYTDLPDPVKERLMEYYFSGLKAHDPKATSGFLEHFPYLAIQRNLQVLGAFGFLTTVKGKRQFVQYIPNALRILHNNLNKLNDPGLRPLCDVVASIVRQL
jgi:aminoglycoside/choline kinase family phosphotransferase